MSCITTTAQEKIEDALDLIIESHPDHFYQAMKKPTLRNWFVGQVMRGLSGKVDIHLVLNVVSEKFERVASRQRLSDAAELFADYARRQDQMDRATWEGLYLQQWPAPERVLVVARSLSSSRGFIQATGHADEGWEAALFSQSLMGRRYDRIFVIRPAGGFTAQEAEYVKVDLTIKLPPDVKPVIV